MVPTSSQAQHPSDRFPESVSVDIEGERHQAFDLGGFTQLLKLDAELVETLALLENLRQVINLQQETVLQYRVTSEALEAQVNLLTEYNEELYDKWKNENKLRHEAENRPRIGNFLGWTLAGVSSITAIILGIVLGVVL